MNALKRDQHTWLVGPLIVDTSSNPLLNYDKLIHEILTLIHQVDTAIKNQANANPQRWFNLI